MIKVFGEGDLLPFIGDFFEMFSIDFTIIYNTDKYVIILVRLCEVSSKVSPILLPTRS